MKLHVLWALLCLVLGFSNAQAKGGDLYIFDVDNTKGAYTPELIEKTLEANGFYISANSEMNKPFTIQFGQTDYTIFTLMTVFELELSEALVRKHEKSGVFVPMGLGIYQHKNEKSLHVSMLTAEAMGKIMGINDPILKKIETKTIEVIKKMLPGATMRQSEAAAKASGPLLSIFEAEVDAQEWQGSKDEIAMMVEEGFKPKGFVMSNYTDYNFMLTKQDTVESPYDFYDTYSICKLKVIYNVAKTRPEAAAFAPCTFVFYKLKGSDKIVLAFPGVYNWIGSAHVTDETALEELKIAQDDFEAIIQAAIE